LLSYADLSQYEPIIAAWASKYIQDVVLVKALHNIIITFD
jgi:hypothetical protein